MYFKYIIKRLITLLPVVIIMSLLVFSLLYVAGGSPAATILGMEATAEQIAELNHKMGYDRPFFVQYFDWLGKIFKGEGSRSIFLKVPVAEALRKNLPYSLELAIFSQIFAIILAVPAGLFAAGNPRSFLDRFVSGASAFFTAMPSFILSLILVLFFSLYLKVLPSSGYKPWSEGALEHIRFMLMPSLALAVTQAGPLARMTRESAAETMRGSLFKSLKARGLSRRRIYYGHLLKNALLPVITLIGESFASVLAGAVIVETVFHVPGLGLLMMNAIQRRDLPLVQGVILLITSIYLLVNLVTDLLYGFLDPRIRLAGNEGE